MRLLTILLLIVSTFGAAYSQDLSCLSVDDIKTVRLMLLDREMFKRQAENADIERAAAIASRDNWRNLYDAEKIRADTVQGGRVDELQKAIAELTQANTELKAANAQLHIQAAADKEKIGEQNADIIKLKSGRKWWLAAGAAAGGVGGYFIGKNADRLIPGQTTQSQFGTAFRF